MSQNVKTKDGGNNHANGHEQDDKATQENLQPELKTLHNAKRESPDTNDKSSTSDADRTFNLFRSLPNVQATKYKRQSSLRNKGRFRNAANKPVNQLIPSK